MASEIDPTLDGTLDDLNASVSKPALKTALTTAANEITELQENGGGGGTGDLSASDLAAGTITPATGNLSFAGTVGYVLTVDGSGNVAPAAPMTVGGVLAPGIIAGANITIADNEDGTVTLVVSTGTATVGDGDYGDIVVSGTGATFTINDEAVTNAKMANMAEARIKGRAVGAGTGVVTDLTGAQAAAILGLTGLTDGDKGDIVVTLSGSTWTIDTGAVTLTKLSSDVQTSLSLANTAVQPATLATELSNLGNLANLDSVSAVGSDILIAGTQGDNRPVVSDGAGGLKFITPTTQSMASASRLIVNQGTTITDASHGYTGSATARICVFRHSTDPTQPVAITLAEGLTQDFIFVAADDQTGLVTFTRSASDTINGATSFSLGGRRAMALFQGSLFGTGLHNVEGQTTEVQTLVSTLEANDQEIKSPLLVDVAEKVQDLGDVSGAIVVDYREGAYVALRLIGAATSLIINNWPATGRLGAITFEIDRGSNGGSAWAWVHPANIVWPDGAAPTLSTGADAIDIVMYSTRWSGTTVLGTFIGKSIG